MPEYFIFLYIMGVISFHNADVIVSLKNKKRLKHFIPNIFTFNSIELSTLDYIFCSDKYLLDINNQFLQHDFYTDIITFDLSDTTKAVVGEIYISTERVRENASILSLPFQQELHRVIFHGALHLAGFKDKKKADRLNMRTVEDFWLNNYFG